MPNLPFPGVEVVDVGPVRVLWLPPHAETGDDSHLTDEDRTLAATIKAESRRREFCRSRLMIRKHSGWRGTLAKTKTGAPLWPDGWTGSLTHKDGWVGLAMDQNLRRSVGIDAEDVARLKVGFEPKILQAEESRRLDAWSQGDPERRLELLAVIFSFKEALFKAVYPLGGTMFYFHDAELMTLDAGTGDLAARILLDTSPLTPAGAVVTGHFVFWKGAGRHFVLTSAELHRVPDAGVRRLDGPRG